MRLFTEFLSRKLTSLLLLSGDRGVVVGRPLRGIYERDALAAKLARQRKFTPDYL